MLSARMFCFDKRFMDVLYNAVNTSHVWLSNTSNAGTHNMELFCIS